LLVSLNSTIEKNQPLFTVHAEAQGELKYALSFLEQGHEIFHIEEI
jgi:thymidine phosphorylase